MSLATLTLQSSAKHRATLIFLHGLSQTAHDWVGPLETISDSLPHLRIVLPTAPLRPLTLLCGLPAHGWFDAYGWGHDPRQDPVGVKASSQMIRSLIGDELSLGVDINRVILGGFSQGGALALYTALTDERQFGGVLAMSTWLPLFRDFPDASPPQGSRLSPILQCHGEKDPTVLPRLGKGSSYVLKSFCPRHELKLYEDLEHDIGDQETSDIIGFLRQHTT